MKQLRKFMKFDYHEFIKDKRIVVAGISEYKDYNTQTHLGTQIEVAIVEDNTNYNNTNGEMTTNLFEKFKVKVPKDITLKLNEEVKIINPVATVYGDYSNHLSVKADNVVPVSNEKNNA